MELVLLFQYFIKSLNFIGSEAQCKFTTTAAVHELLMSLPKLLTLSTCSYDNFYVPQDRSSMTQLRISNLDQQRSNQKTNQSDVGSWLARQTLLCLLFATYIRYFYTKVIRRWHIPRHPEKSIYVIYTKIRT